MSLMRYRMTREEFISQQTDSERRIVRRVVPYGIIYSIRLVSAVAIVLLAVLLWIYFATDARNSILYELGFCLLLFVGSFPVERDTRRQFPRLGLRCPSCQSYLIFLDGRKTAETGCCHHCGERIFDA